MKINRLSVYFMLIASMIVAGCGENSKDSAKVSPTASTTQQNQRHCPQEHRELLSKLGIQVPEDSAISFYTIDDQNSIVSEYYIKDSKYDKIKVVLHEEKNTIGKIKSVSVMHSDCYKSVYAFNDGKILGTLDECYEKHVAKEPRKAESFAPEDKSPQTVAVSDLDFMKDYNTVMSRQYNGLYAGSKISIGRVTAGSIHIYVAPMWYSLNEGEKTAFVTQATKWYFGMMGARSMSYQINQIDIYFKDANSGAQVATWGSVRGPVIDK